MRGESGEGSGGGTTLIVFIVQRNSLKTFKARTNSCERSRRAEDRSHVCLLEQLHLAPSPETHTRAPVPAWPLKRVRRCSPCRPALFTLVPVLSVEQTSHCFTKPPRLTAANSLLASVKTHTHTHTISHSLLRLPRNINLSL